MPKATVVQVHGNMAIVQIEGRQFPAIALQGDTFHNLVGYVRRAAESPDPQFRDEELREALKQMDAAIDVYARALRSQGRRLPW